MYMPFQQTGSTVKVTANNTPTSVSGTLATNAGDNTTSLRVWNAGSVTVFVNPGGATAAVTNIPVGAGEIIFLAYNGTAVSVISSTTTACDVYFTPGLGGF